MSATRVVLGVPKELTPGERRVAAIPGTCQKYVAMGMDVLVEAGAGQGAFYSDEEYRAAGTEIVDDVKSLFDRANVILKVKELQPNSAEGKHEVDLLRDGATLICFLHPASPLNHDLVRAIRDRGITALTMDSIPRITRAQKMDALTAMSTVAGYKAVVMAADRFSRFIPMTMTAVGMLPPAQVLVIGTGIVGLQAIATAKRLGGVVSAVDIRSEAREQAASVGAKVVGFDVPAELAVGQGGYAQALLEEWLLKEREALAPLVRQADIVITGALVPGETAPVLITEDMVAGMRNGSIICDVSVDQGGNCSLTRFNEEVWQHGVLISGIANLPGYVPRDATTMYANTVCSFVEALMRNGELVIDRSDEIVNGTLVTIGGEIVHHGTLKAMGQAA
jgi:H+-translocating NAD(P) transhydrogenase subunit alpha